MKNTCVSAHHVCLYIVIISQKRSALQYLSVHWLCVMCSCEYVPCHTHVTRRFHTRLWWMKTHSLVAGTVAENGQPFLYVFLALAMSHGCICHCKVVSCKALCWLSTGGNNEHGPLEIEVAERPHSSKAVSVRSSRSLVLLVRLLTSLKGFRFCVPCNVSLVQRL